MKYKRKDSLKNFRKKRKSDFYLILSISFLFLLGIYLLNYFDGFSFLYEIFEEPREINIPDECSLIMGNLIHQIRDGDDCRLRCKNICKMNELKFDSFNFVESKNSCHNCTCYCD